jgi:hypothetical protein
VEAIFSKISAKKYIYKIEYISKSGLLPHFLLILNMKKKFFVGFKMESDVQDGGRKSRKQSFEICLQTFAMGLNMPPPAT